MKKIYSISLISFVIMAGFSLQSCDKIKDKFFPGFETQPNAVEITIPVISSTTAQTSAGTLTTYFNMDSIIKAETLNAFSIRNVDKISLQGLSLQLQNADNENHFGNMENLSVSFHSNANPNVAVIANAPMIADENITELVLIPETSLNLRSYMDGKELTYSISGKARRVTSKPLSCLLHIRLKLN